MRRFLFAAGGLLGAVLLLLQLMKMRVIELGFMSPSWGLWLIPVLLVAGPAAGSLFARAKSWLAGVLVLLLLVVIPIGLELQSEVGTGHGPVGRRAMQQRVTDLKGAAVAAATREFGPGSRQVQEECGNSCRGVIVSVAGDGRRVWYWYVNGQLDTVLDRERLQSELAPILPPGAQVTGLDGGSDPWRLTFTYAGPSGESQGRVWLRTPNERLSLWSVELEGRLPVEFMLPLRTGNTYWEVRRAAALRRIRAYNAVLAAHGQEVDAIRFGSDTYGRCEQVLVRVNRSQPVWYWYDDREGRVLARAPLERVADRSQPSPELGAPAAHRRAESQSGAGSRRPAGRAPPTAHALALTQPFFCPNSLPNMLTVAQTGPVRDSGGSSFHVHWRDQPQAHRRPDRDLRTDLLRPRGPHVLPADRRRRSALRQGLPLPDAADADPG